MVVVCGERSRSGDAAIHRNRYGASKWSRTVRIGASSDFGAQIAEIRRCADARRLGPLQRRITNPMDGSISGAKTFTTDR